MHQTVRCGLLGAAVAAGCLAGIGIVATIGSLVFGTSLIVPFLVTVSASIDQGVPSMEFRPDWAGIVLAFGFLTVVVARAVATGGTAPANDLSAPVVTAEPRDRQYI